MSTQPEPVALEAHGSSRSSARGRGRPCAARRRHHRRRRRVRRDHGPVRLGQEHAPAHPRRARPARRQAPSTIHGRRYDDLDDRALTRLRGEVFGFVFQFFNLLPTLTAAENVAAAGARRRRAPARRTPSASDELLALVGLERARRAPAVGAVRRRAAAGRDRPRAAAAPAGAARRRADRQPRLRRRRGRAAAAAPARRRRADRRHGHARRRRGRRSPTASCSCATARSRARSRAATASASADALRVVQAAAYAGRAAS